MRFASDIQGSYNSLRPTKMFLFALQRLDFVHLFTIYAWIGGN